MWHLLQVLLKDALRAKRVDLLIPIILQLLALVDLDIDNLRVNLYVLLGVLIEV